MTTSPGNVVRAYDKEKTICDLIRHKGKAEFETYPKALNLYARSTDKDINKLMEYARVLKIEKEVRISSYDSYGPYLLAISLNIDVLPASFSFRPPPFSE